MKKITAKAQKREAAPKVLTSNDNVQEKKILSGKDVVGVCESKIINIEIPGWDACIRARVPTPKMILELRTKAATNEIFQEKLFRACLIDFTEDDFNALEDSNGLRYYELMTAVVENTDLFSRALTKDNVKK